MSTVLIVHGPNMNLLGRREPSFYGKVSLRKLNKHLEGIGKNLEIKTLFYQSNVEGNIVTKIQKMVEKIDGLLINPAAYTHTSVAIRDVLLAIDLPTVEIHCTNIYKREPFRKHSLISDIVDGQVVGFGIESYKLGLEALSHLILKKGKPPVGFL